MSLTIAACTRSRERAAEAATPDAGASAHHQEVAASSGRYAATALDLDGKLDEALPLYHRRAAQTMTKADRLRYAEALMRAGQRDNAEALMNELAKEIGSTAHHDNRGQAPALCASAMLLDGFPRAAASYAKAASEAAPENPEYALLLARSLAASGDTDEARAVIAKLRRPAGDWPYGTQLEVARWLARTGDLRSPLPLLKGRAPSAIGEMFRESIRGEIESMRGDWASAEGSLSLAEGSAPHGLDGARVAPQWRNARRELFWIRLKRAACLLDAHKTDEAASEARKAIGSDEEFVRSAAIVLLARIDFERRDTSAAIARLRALAGHDRRYAMAADRVRAPGWSKDDVRDALLQLRTVLNDEDRSASFVTTPILARLDDSSRRIAVDESARRLASQAQ